MKRKCLCSLLVMMCCYCTAFGQWVVSDPALTQLSQITWAKELTQAYEQFQVLGESRDILTKSLDLYRQVNGVIKNSKMVLQVLSMQGVRKKKRPVLLPSWCVRRNMLSHWVI